MTKAFFPHNGLARIGLAAHQSRIPRGGFFGFVLVALLAFSGAAARASDPIGAFAIIDKAVLIPNESSPETIQLHGVFCLATPDNRNTYQKPKAGRMIFTLPAEKREAALKEWKDLKKIAGTGDIIGFGSRFAPMGAVLEKDNAADKPVAYPVAFGLARSSQRSDDYEPIKALRAFPPRTAGLPKPALRPQTALAKN